MRTVAEKWASFEEHVTPTEAHREPMRAAFYCGAASLLNLLLENVIRAQSPADCQRDLEALNAELATFAVLSAASRVESDDVRQTQQANRKGIS